MIRTTKVNDNYIAKFPEMKLAHDLLDGLTGIELGAAAHNPFGLKGSLNIAPEDDFGFYQGAQVEMCGEYAEINQYQEAHELSLLDNGTEYIISSHVFEHLPDPIAALVEWNRVVRDGGIVFMIVPVPGALADDKGQRHTPTCGLLGELHWRSFLKMIASTRTASSAGAGQSGRLRSAY
jgi:hypothetical protein